jgi:hypothetical protein
MKPRDIDSGETCETCKFWDDYGDEDDAKPREGACCRFPPQRNMKPDEEDTPSHQLWSYPVTGGHWWCGEWRPLQRLPAITSSEISEIISAR